MGVWKINMHPQPECPECEKLAKVSEESNKIGDFLNWLSAYDIVLGGWQGDEFVPSDFRLSDSGINKMLAEYFEIDLDKVDNEHRELLKWLQEKYEEES